MKDTTTNNETIKQFLAGTLDQLGAMSNTQAWDKLLTTNPELQQAYEEASNALDSLWLKLVILCMDESNLD